MPIYEFQCEECGEVKEGLFRKADDAPEKILVLCPRAREPRYHRRIISSSAFHLKGKGWSQDGYENPTKDMPGGQHSGEKFLREYRKAVSDPEHPYKPGDYLKKHRKNDDFSDL